MLLKDVYSASENVHHIRAAADKVTIIDGFEGDHVKDPNSVYNGKRMVNGWNNSGAPWTYDINPDPMLLSGE